MRINVNVDQIRKLRGAEYCAECERVGAWLASRLLSEAPSEVVDALQQFLREYDNASTDPRDENYHMDVLAKIRAIAERQE